MSITILADPLTRPQAVALAQQMYADGEGWRITEIRDYLADRGVSVHWDTIKAWANPEWAKQRNLKLRGAQRRYKRRINGSKYFRVLDDDALKRLGREPNKPALTPDLLLAMRLDDGLSYAAIAAIARRFFDEDVTEDQMRHRLYELGAQKNPNKSRANYRKAAA